MKNKKTFMIIRDNSFYLMTNEENSIHECNFSSIKIIPGIYCFQNLFEEENANSNLLMDVFSKNNLFDKTKLFIKSSLEQIFVAIPDDLQPVEKKFLEEFLMNTFGIKLKINFITENMLVSDEERSYICVYKTCRMFVISYIGYNKINAQLLLERKDYSEEELKEFINNIHYDAKYDTLKVYLIGEGMEKYSSIGQVVQYDELLRNFVNITEE